MTTLALHQRLADAFQAVSARDPHSLNALRSLYTDDLVFEDPIQITRSYDDFHAAMRRLVQRARKLRFEVTDAFGDETRACITWTMRMTPPLGPTLIIDGVSHVQAREGRVFNQRDYWDFNTSVARSFPGGLTLLRWLLRPFA